VEEMSAFESGLIQIEVTKSFYPQNPEKEQYEVFVKGCNLTFSLIGQLRCHGDTLFISLVS
jgi:hypothetical protein